MKKKELKQIIKEVIKEIQMGSKVPSGMGHAQSGPRPRNVASGIKQSTHMGPLKTFYANSMNDIPAVAAQIQSMKPDFNASVFVDKLAKMDLKTLNELDLGNCKCIHPRGPGFCVIGACVMVIKNMDGLKITINI